MGRDLGKLGLDRNECPRQWEGLTQGVEMVKIKTMILDQAVVKAATLHAQEGIPRLQEDLTLRVDEYRRQENHP
jgi:hypothetical protein